MATAPKAKKPAASKGKGKAAPKTKAPAKKCKAKAAADGLSRPSVSAPVGRGRPTKYTPDMCETAIELGKAGKSLEYIAGTLGIAYDTLNEWAKSNPDFSAAITLAKQYELIWWEDAGQNNMLTVGFSSSAWSRSMAARFPNKWREASKHEVTGKDGEKLIPENASSREVARAVLDILREAKTSDAA